LTMVMSDDSILFRTPPIFLTYCTYADRGVKKFISATLSIFYIDLNISWQRDYFLSAFLSSEAL
ncbi:hypothetical protein, partial [Psychrobacter sp. APC 3350]|uniref:hypothetical protein n=1 Tax=Psychrobacter sp. APC 3350 TaxID=3035195 RepID=UPI0025B61D81